MNSSSNSQYVINRNQFSSPSNQNGRQARLDVRLNSCAFPRLREALQFQSTQREPRATTQGGGSEPSTAKMIWKMSKEILSLGFGTFADMAERANELAGSVVSQRR